MKTTTTDQTGIEETAGNGHFLPDAKTDKSPIGVTNIPIPQQTPITHQHQTYHQGPTNIGGTSTGQQNGTSPRPTTTREEVTHTDDGQPPGNRAQLPRTKHMDDTQNMNIDIIAETFNCHGFAQSSEYVINRLKSCNILCLTETWIWPHEISLVSDTISNHPAIRNSS